MKTIPRNLIEDKTYCVNYIVYLNDDNLREFVYIAVRKDKMEVFQQAVKHGHFDAEDYGVILEHGEGEPTEYVKSTMKMLYKCNHDSGISLVDYKVE